MRRLVIRSLLPAVAIALAFVLGTTPAYAYPPDPPSVSTSQTYLNALTVRAEGSTDGYSRDLFPHWHIVSGNCDTRESRHRPRRICTRHPDWCLKTQVILSTTCR